MTLNDKATRKGLQRSTVTGGEAGGSSGLARTDMDTDIWGGQPAKEGEVYCVSCLKCAGRLAQTRLGGTPFSKS